MLITTAALDELTAQAKASQRLRMNLDLRNSPADQSQRMLNALESGTMILETKDGAWSALEDEDLL